VYFPRRRFIITITTRIIFLLLLLLPYAALATPAQISLTREVATSEGWLALLHYEHRFFGAHNSLVDDPSFFFAERGATDPLVELEATLVAMNRELPTDHNQHPACLMPARAAFLSSYFNQIEAIVGKLDCTEFQSWSEGINARYVTLVFPSSFINNPASAFGHTFLRLDPDQTLPLISYAANYEARTSGADSGFVYAIKGIFGGYHGEFTVAPYYQKVNQYSDLEHRDIWEYRLNFTQAEVEQLVRHLWELRGVAFDYYYFDENCSYQLLSLLEVVRPELRVKRSFSSWVIPIDTVRVLLEIPEILKSVEYRPSRASILNTLEARSTSEELRLAKEISSGKLQPNQLSQRGLTESQQIEILELAHEVILYRMLSTTKESTELRERAHAVLLSRSKLPAAAPVQVPPPKVRPDEGHRTGRARIAFGVASGTPLYRLEYRAAYHDLLDPAGGFLPGSAIELGSFSLEHRRSESLKLHNVTLLRAESLSPRSTFIKPLSWSLAAELKRMLRYDKRPLIGALDGGVGFSWQLDQTLLSTFARVSSYTGSGLRRGYSLGTGGKVMSLSQLSDRLGVAITGEALRYGVGDSFSKYRYGLESRYTLARDLAFRAGIERTHGKGTVETTSLASIDLFF